LPHQWEFVRLPAEMTKLTLSQLSSLLFRACDDLRGNIVVHELCHVHHLNHTEAFWGEVDKVMPRYRERREWLKKNGAAMDL